MPNRNKQRGTQRELDVKRVYEKRGYTVIRSAGSMGAADLVAGKAGGYQTQLIEVKSGARGPWTGGFNAEARAEFAARAKKAGWLPVVVWWPYDRQGPRFLPEEAWPKNGK